LTMRRWGWQCDWRRLSPIDTITLTEVDACSYRRQRTLMRWRCAGDALPRVGVLSVRLSVDCNLFTIPDHMGLVSRESRRWYTVSHSGHG
jgi:hypothetical protein